MSPAPTTLRRSTRLRAGLATPFLALVVGVALPERAAAAEPTVDLRGTWYVLVHYKDSATANPDSWRWDDRVWEFEEKGSRIRWTEYPIVVFDDESGRFEGRHRVLAAWEPNEAQWQEILGGLQVNSRGSKGKSLRPARDGSAWETVGQMNVMSASAIGYFEDWNVADPTGEPVFTRDDVLGSARAEGLEGRTRYTTTEVLEGGSELRGKFVRDGTRVGTFRMIRSGERRGIETAAKSAQERFEKERDRAIEAARRQAVERERSGEAPDYNEDFPVAAATLADVLDAIRARPDEDSLVLVQKLAIFRLDDEEWEEVSEEEALANAEDADFAVAANRLCNSTEATPEFYTWETADWFLLDDNALRAWDFTPFKRRCSFSFRFFPAREDWVPLEERFTEWMAENFPRGKTSKIQFYRRGIGYAYAGRVEDAEAMLAAGDETLEESTRIGTVIRREPGDRGHLASQSEWERQRQLLVEEIRRAREQAGDVDGERG